MLLLLLLVVIFVIGLGYIFYKIKTKPVDCVVSDWSNWADCSNNIQTRTKTVITQKAHGGKDCPTNNMQEQRFCDFKLALLKNQNQLRIDGQNLFVNDSILYQMKQILNDIYKRTCGTDSNKLLLLQNPISMNDLIPIIQNLTYRIIASTTLSNQQKDDIQTLFMIVEATRSGFGIDVNNNITTTDPIYRIIFNLQTPISYEQFKQNALDLLLKLKDRAALTDLEKRIFASLSNKTVDKLTSDDIKDINSKVDSTINEYNAAQNRCL